MLGLSSLRKLCVFCACAFPTHRLSPAHSKEPRIATQVRLQPPLDSAALRM